MLFKVLKNLIKVNGLTDELREKIDVFFAAGRLTVDEYIELTTVTE